jgi:hypothetical protein
MSVVHHVCCLLPQDDYPGLAAYLYQKNAGSTAAATTLQP